MKLKKLVTQSDYQQAITRFEKIFQAKKGTPESDEANSLSLLIEEYENKHFKITKMPAK